MPPPPPPCNFTAYLQCFGAPDCTSLLRTTPLPNFIAAYSQCFGAPCLLASRCACVDHAASWDCHHVQTLSLPRIVFALRKACSEKLHFYQHHRVASAPYLRILFMPCTHLTCAVMGGLGERRLGGPVPPHPAGGSRRCVARRVASGATCLGTWRVNSRLQAFGTEAEIGPEAVPTKSRRVGHFYALTLGRLASGLLRPFTLMGRGD